MWVLRSGFITAIGHVPLLLCPSFVDRSGLFLLSLRGSILKVMVPNVLGIGIDLENFETKTPWIQ
jgi:hypothetical protein